MIGRLQQAYARHLIAVTDVIHRKSRSIGHAAPARLGADGSR
jgi:hypothetical protein